jgi:hypothetical protein|tara:strand:+ start:7635 stop:7805 length:171 start_codon:yes stop_codon:yes gene_type:complete
MRTGCATQVVADQAAGARGQIDQGRKMAMLARRSDQRHFLLLGWRELDYRRCAAQR